LARYIRTGKVCSHAGEARESSFGRSIVVQNLVGEFVTIAEACKRLGVAPNTLRSWGAHGKIEEYRHPLNNYRLYRLDDLELLVEKLQSPLKLSELKANPKKKR